MRDIAEVPNEYKETVDFYQKATEDEQVQNVMTDVFANDSIAPDNPLGHSKSTIVKLLFRFSNGKYDNANVDEEQAQQEYRKAAKNQIVDYGKNKKGLTYLMKRIGLNWFENHGFDTTGRIKVMRALKCVMDLVKNKGINTN